MYHAWIALVLYCIYLAVVYMVEPRHNPMRWLLHGLAFLVILGVTIFDLQMHREYFTSHVSEVSFCGPCDPDNSGSSCQGDPSYTCKNQQWIQMVGQ